MRCSNATIESFSPTSTSTSTPIEEKRGDMSKSKNKENQCEGICFGCSQMKNDEHVCSSQLLADSYSTLSEMANEQLNLLEKFTLGSIHQKYEDELSRWHKSAIHHLTDIYDQRLNELSTLFNNDLLPQLKKTQQTIIQQLQKKILPQIQQMKAQSNEDPKKMQRIQGLLSEMKCEYELINDRQWIEVDLPDMKHFSVPIRIAKMAAAARLTDGEKDPLECLSDEEKKIDPTDDDDDDDEDEDPHRLNGEESKFKSHAEDFNSSKPTKKKKLAQRIDLMEVFAKNPEPFKAHLLETNSSTLAFSSTHLLVHDQKKLILFDLKKKLHEFNWNDNEFGILVDMCWMSSISLFILLTIHSVYLYDPQKSLDNKPVKVESIRPSDRTHVLASLCPLDRDLFINYHKGIHLDQYRVLASSEFVLQRRYSKAELCEANDIGIRDIRSNGECLCLSIMQSEDCKWRLDLMSRDMVRVRRGVPMDSGENQQKFFSMLIPIDQQRWLFVNWFTNKLWIVDQQGKTRCVKESIMKNIRNCSLSPDLNHFAIRSEKPSFVNIYKLDQ